MDDDAVMLCECLSAATGVATDIMVVVEVVLVPTSALALFVGRVNPLSPSDVDLLVGEGKILPPSDLTLLVGWVNSLPPSDAELEVGPGKALPLSDVALLLGWIKSSHLSDVVLVVEEVKFSRPSSVVAVWLMLV